MNSKIINVLICIVSILIFFGVFAPSAFSKDLETLKVTDMEEDFKYMVLPPGKANAKSLFCTETASQGNRSLRFECAGNERVGLYIPFEKDASDYDTLAFDFYCESNNDATMMPYVIEKTGTVSRAYVNLREGRDGWVTLRFKKDKNFKLRGATKADWSKIEMLNFDFIRGTRGKMIIYLDNIRFEKSKDGSDSGNLLYNSSFEKTTNPSVPDGWHRDLHYPPFGKDIWSIDDKVAFHGKKSLRIGLKGKTLAAMEQHARVSKEQEYTFSIYMKSDKDDTNVDLRVNGLKIPGREKIVIVGKEWKRYSVTGEAISTYASPRITLESENAALWCDAAQLVDGKDVKPYKAPVEETDNDTKKAYPKKSEDGPVVEIKETEDGPVIDGKLDDKCWETAVTMKDFFKCDDKSLSPDKTEAKVVFDDQAIYVSVFAEEKNVESVKKTLDSSKHGPWGTDLIEVFIDLNNDGSSYYHFAANPKGEKYAVSFTEPNKRITWDCDWSAAGKVLKNGWTLEIKIPYTCFALSGINKNTDIGINICRTSLEPTRNSAWSYPGGGFHTPWAFGTLKEFRPEVLKGFLFDIVSLNWSRGKATATVQNKTGSDAALNLSFEIIAPDTQKISTKPVYKTVNDGALADIEVPLPLEKDGLYKLRISGVDKNGIKRLVSQYRKVKISGNTLFDFSGTELDFYTNEQTAKARCLIGADNKRCKNLKLCWSIQKDGETIGKINTMPLKPGINVWEFPLNKLSNGSYRLIGELLENSTVLNKQECVFRKLPPAKQEVRINRWGQFFVYNGTPIFPYGFYDNNVDYDNLKAWTDMLADTQKADCTVHMVYMGNSPRIHEEIGKYLDAAEKSGQKVWICLSGMFAWHLEKYKSQRLRYHSEEEAAEGLRKLVSKYKDHPALFGWCTIDEPSNRPNIFPAAVMEKYYGQVKALDPYHPCAPSHQTHMTDAKLLDAAADCAFIPYLIGRFDYLFQEFKSLKEPIIANTPCYGGVGSIMREPTASEQRINMYSAVINGAGGLCLYTYRPAGTELWNEFIEIGKELKYLSPALLTPDDKLDLEVSATDDNVSGILKKYRDKYYLIAVNTASRPIDVVFRLNAVPEISSVKALFKTKAPKVEKKLKTLKLTMDKQSTALYEIR
ncbi:MAG: hypothetical protein A2017_10905 [Lentisphaerae bacterium GWF2_44_16]|nr:MAG: hypothetical protein A2017_10905 [Lentisphaerae bacterium GWF2_44_16]